MKLSNKQWKIIKEEFKLKEDTKTIIESLLSSNCAIIVGENEDLVIEGFNKKTEDRIKEILRENDK